jgi:acetylornithine/succinyldiaminopimelate/putrescine aminotransferase
MSITNTSLIDREHAHFLQTYKRLPIEVDRAEGIHVYSTDGTRYLDFLGGIAVNALGHAHPGIIAAVEAQLRRYTHLSNYFYQDAQIEFVERLCEATGFDRAFLSSSGAETNEGAMKFVRKHFANQGRTRIFGFTGGFHGRSYGVLSIMDRPLYKDGMGPFLPDTSVLPFNNSEVLRASVDATTCAVFIEFLQGEGGVRWATPEFAQTLAELREEHGFLIVADEVQAGGGRTGDFFSFERFGIQPDVVTLAKGIGGGLPLGAMLVHEELASVWGGGHHGTTFGGNALACAAGCVVLDTVQGGLMENVRTVGEYFMRGLHDVAAGFPDLVVEVRGAGAMAGIELNVTAAPYVDAMLRRRVIINATADKVLRFLPPYIFSKENVDEMLAALRESLAEV